MKKYTILLLFLVVFAGLVLAQNPVTQSSLGDSYFPELGNGGYDVQHYHLDITPDFEVETLDATVTLLLQATQELIEFNLDFWGYDITETTVNRIPAEFRRDGVELTIIPSEPIAMDELVSVEISYNGKPREGLNTTYYPIGSSGWNFHDSGSFVTSQPRGASLWFPANDYPADKATYSFDITVPSSYVVATNGDLLEVVENGDKSTYRSETNDLMASYLVTVHVGDFVRYDRQTESGVPIRDYYARSFDATARGLFFETADMLTFYEEIIGEYPFDVYGSVVSDFELPFALETQTLSTYGTRILEDSVRTHVTMAHELVHQWFGNSVSPARWQDIWLNEGFASYLSLLWAQEKYGDSILNTILGNWYDSMLEPDFMSSAPKAIGNPLPSQMFHPTVYWKGALTLHALRQRVGDDTFFELIRIYYQTYRDGSAQVEDFIALANEISGEDLTDFFNSWLYERNVPEIELG